jgi:hypothetical protein
MAAISLAQQRDSLVWSRRKAPVAVTVRIVCDTGGTGEHGHVHEAEPPREVIFPSRPPTRRAFLTGVGATLATVGALPALGAGRAAADTLPTPVPPAVLPSGLTAHRAAMHVHGSFSEGSGSWAQHFSEAARTGVDILVPTDHDWRVMQRNYGGVFHFSGPVEQTPSGEYNLTLLDSADLAAGSGGTLVSTAAPADTTAGAGSLRLVVESAGALDAQVAYEIDSGPSSSDLNGTVLGRTLHFWVQMATASTAEAFLGVQLALSRDPANGPKTLTYRVSSDVTARVLTVQGANAYIDLPVVVGEWTELVTDLAGDVAEAWPALDGGDCGLSQVAVVGRSTTTAVVDGLVSFLSFVTDPGYDGRTALASVLAPLRVQYPDLFVPVGLEHSLDQHLGQVGGDRFFYDYPPGTSAHMPLPDDVTLDQVNAIKAHGGVAIYNHPFGTTNSSPTGAARDAILAKIIARVLANGLFGADAVEVGYDSRGMDLAGHLELWDCLSANGKIFTGVGCSDDHEGKDWLAQRNRFVTLPLMTELRGWSLRTALWRGRAAVGLLGDFTGALDLSINRDAYQGEVRTAATDSADAVVIDGIDLPDGSAVEVSWGPVDFGGPAFTRSSVVATVSGADVNAGGVSVPAPDRGPGYYRANVVDPDGRVLAFSNPVYAVPGGADWIPPDRIANPKRLVP